MHLQAAIGKHTILKNTFDILEDDWCQKVEDMNNEQELYHLGGRDFTQPSSILIPDGFEVK